MQHTGKILILTPMKDAVEFLDGYFQGLSQLTYPAELISVGILEGDSTDGTYSDLQRRLPQLNEQFRRVRTWKKDFGFRIPPGRDRSAGELQSIRRSVLARSRNHLLARALDDEDWVLWLDVDVIEYPPDIVERLLATGKRILQPHCVLEYGKKTYDLNAWRDHGLLHMDKMRKEGSVVPLHAVGGTMLLVHADIHRDGLVYPTFYYGLQNPLARPGQGEIETEGLGIMAKDMGHQCWGLPNLEIKHHSYLPPELKLLKRMRKGTWDRAIAESVMSLNEYRINRLAQDDIVLDIGAHIGSFSVFAAVRGAGRIVGFEPLPENFEIAMENCSGYPQIEIRNAAVWRSDGRDGTLKHSGIPRHNTGGGDVLGKKGVAVSSVSLDSVLEELGHVRLAKIDCEGAEFPIVLTSRKLEQIDEIILEYHEMSEIPEVARVEGYTNFRRHHLDEYLSKQGFVVTVDEPTQFPADGVFTGARSLLVARRR
jgi:FkbM family methyltransferase